MRDVILGTYDTIEVAARVWDFAVLSLRGVDTQTVTNFDKGSYLGADGMLLPVEAALPGLGCNQHRLVSDKLTAAGVGAGGAEGDSASDGGSSSDSDSAGGSAYPGTSTVGTRPPVRSRGPAPGGGAPSRHGQARGAQLGSPALQLPPQQQQQQAQQQQQLAPPAKYRGNTGEDAARVFDFTVLSLRGVDTQSVINCDKGSYLGANGTLLPMEAALPGLERAEHKFVRDKLAGVMVVVSRPEDGSGRLAIKIMEPMLSLIMRHTLRTKIYLGTFGTGEGAARVYDFAVLSLRGVDTQTVINFDKGAYLGADGALLPVEAALPGLGRDQHRHVRDKLAAAVVGAGGGAGGMSEGGALSSTSSDSSSDSGSASPGTAAAGARPPVHMRRPAQGARQAGSPAPRRQAQRQLPPVPPVKYHGVSQIKSGRQFNLGTYDTNEDAARVYNFAALSLHGVDTQTATNFDKGTYLSADGTLLPVEAALLGLDRNQHRLVRDKLAAAVVGAGGGAEGEAEGMADGSSSSSDSDSAGGSAGRGTAATRSPLGGHTIDPVASSILRALRIVHLGTHGTKEDASRVWDFAVLSLRGVDTQTVTNFYKGAYLGADGALLAVEAALPGLGRDKHRLVRDKLAAAAKKGRSQAHAQQLPSGAAKGAQKRTAPSEQPQAKAKSAFRGVSADGSNWAAKLWDGDTHSDIFLGNFGCEEQAARAFDRASVVFRGTEAKSNFPVTEYHSEMSQLTKMTRMEVVAYVKRGTRGLSSKGEAKCRGVKQTTSGRWEAHVRIGGRVVNLGTHDTEGDAARVYDFAVLSVRGSGKYAITNFDVSAYLGADGALLPVEAALPGLGRDMHKYVRYKLAASGVVAAGATAEGSDGRADSNSGSDSDGGSAYPGTAAVAALPPLRNLGPASGGGAPSRHGQARGAWQAISPAPLRQTQQQLPHVPRAKYHGVRQTKSGRWEARACVGDRTVTLGTHDTGEDAARVYDFAVLFLRGGDTQTVINLDKGDYLGADGALLPVEAALSGLEHDQHRLVRDKLAAAGQQPVLQAQTQQLPPAPPLPPHQPVPQAPPPQQAQQQQLPAPQAHEAPPAVGSAAHDFHTKTSALAFLCNLKAAFDNSVLPLDVYEEQRAEAMAALRMQ
ncbi:hypothetical protein FOA52_001360 [Chlamydomonas sp. UWO 241]|nr:hypothetical protein FOA52_001360 [Chlamydomonas sp. UWO 241]